MVGWVRMHNSQHIEILAHGERILVEALEVSCSLGPIEAQVHSIRTQNINPISAYARQNSKFVEYSAQEFFQDASLDHEPAPRRSD